MAARSSQPSVDPTADALMKLTFTDKLPHPGLSSAASAPSVPNRLGLGGLAARRAGAQAPRLSAKDIGAEIGMPAGGGPSGAGLGGGRPMFDEAPRRSPQSTWGTPFANFSKIVSVSSRTFLEPKLMS